MIERKNHIPDLPFPGKPDDLYEIAMLPARIPADWWIASDGHDQAVWAPSGRPSRPTVMIRDFQVAPPVWAVFAAVLPDRGDCIMCTAVPCIDHDGSA